MLDLTFLFSIQIFLCVDHRALPFCLCRKYLWFVRLEPASRAVYVCASPFFVGGGLQICGQKVFAFTQDLQETSCSRTNSHFLGFAILFTRKSTFLFVHTDSVLTTKIVESLRKHYIFLRPRRFSSAKIPAEKTSKAANAIKANMK